jgi:hypothetical protein
MTPIANAIEKSKDETGDHVACSDLSPSFLLHAIPEVWSVQNIQAPFDHFNDGNSNRDCESKKQNKLDDHFFDPRRCRIILVQQRDPSTRSRL